MTDNEIIKALERCPQHAECCYCNSLEECGNKRILTTSVFDLINRQKAEIERLEKEAKDKERAYNDEFCSRKEWQTKCRELLKEKQITKSEAMKEFAEKIDKLLERYSHIHENAEIAMQDVIECDNETIEMQSVWDVHTLIANEMGSEPEEMNKLQDNIETIAKERLLKEIEKDFRLLVKEMTEVEE